MSTRRMQARILLLAILSLAIAGGLSLCPLPGSFSLLGSAFELAVPRALALFACAPWVASVALLSLDHASPLRRLVGLLVRLAFVSALIIALCQPSMVRLSSRLFAVVLLDESDSMPERSIATSRRNVAEAVSLKRGGDEIRVIAFARTPKLVPIVPGKLSAPFPTQDASRVGQLGPALGSATDIASALRLARGLFPPGYVKRVALMSDGLETKGDLLAEAREAAHDGVRIFVSSPEERPPPDVLVSSIVVPLQVRASETVSLHVHIYSNRDVRGELTLKQGGSLNAPDGTRSVSLRTGDNDVVMQSRATAKGEVTYEAEVTGVFEDASPHNNLLRKTVGVTGPPTVLYVQARKLPQENLVRALVAEGLDVDTVSPGGVPRGAALGRYDFVILSDIPSGELSDAETASLESFVREGGGLLWAVGPRATAASAGRGGGLVSLSPLTIRSEALLTVPAVAMSLLIDRSGSMTGLPLEMAKAAARATASALAREDLIEVIAFDSAATRVVPLTPLNRRDAILDGIARIAPGGGTAIRPALDVAYQSLVPARAKRKHVVLLTDGEADARGIRELTVAMAAEGITVSTIGLGGEIDESLLRMIAEVGGGRFYRAEDPGALPRIFVREAEVVAKKPETIADVRVRVIGSAPFLRGIDVGAAPPLHGHATTEVRGTPAELLLSAGERDPLLARWHIGLGWSVAWATSLSAPWASDWLRWPSYAKFFSQLVREHMRARATHSLPLALSLDPDTGLVSAVVDARGDNDEFLDDLSGAVHVEPSERESAADGVRASFDVPLRHSAPGRYEAAWAGAVAGSRRVTARLSAGPAAGSQVREMVAYEDPPAPTESMSLGTNRELLDRAASVSGGGMGGLDRALDPRSDTAPMRVELWLRSVLLAIGLLLLDVAVRRIPSRRA